MGAAEASICQRVDVATAAWLRRAAATTKDRAEACAPALSKGGEEENLLVVRIPRPLQGVLTLSLRLSYEQLSHRLSLDKE